MPRVYKFNLIFCYMVLLQACSMQSMMVDAKTTNTPPGQVIIVGMFEVNPPLDKAEKELSRGSGYFTQVKSYNKVFFSTTNQPITDLDVTMLSRQWNNTLSATWGDIYFKQTAAKKTYLNAGAFHVDARTMDKAWLPGGMFFLPPANARAVYLGTVRFTRDDFWNITKVQVIDEYKAAKTEFTRRFGSSVQLKKALLRFQQ